MLEPGLSCDTVPISDYSQKQFNLFHRLNYEREIRNLSGVFAILKLNEKSKFVRCDKLNSWFKFYSATHTLIEIYVFIF